MVYPKKSPPYKQLAHQHERQVASLSERVIRCNIVIPNAREGTHKGRTSRTKESHKPGTSQTKKSLIHEIPRHDVPRNDGRKKVSFWANAKNPINPGPPERREPSFMRLLVTTFLGMTKGNKWHPTNHPSDTDKK